MTNKMGLDTSELGAAASETNSIGLCSLCGEVAQLKCDRCGDFYCTEFCQRRDWQNHRYICFPIPKLVKVGCDMPIKKTTSDEEVKSQSIPTSIKSTTPIKENTSKTNQNQSLSTSIKSTKPQNGSCVVLTGFKSSNRCYIRSTTPFIVNEYKKVLNEIHEFGKKSSPLQKNPKTNSYALALRDDKWCRVQILGNRQQNYLRIAFVDYGNISKRFVNDMRKIDDSLINLPCFIHIVQLNDIKFSIESSVMESLKKYTNKEYKVEFLKPREGFDNVKLFEWGSNILLNTSVTNLLNNQKNNKDIDHGSSNSSIINAKRNDLEKPKINGTSNKETCEASTKTSQKNVNGVKNNELNEKHLNETLNKNDSDIKDTISKNNQMCTSEKSSVVSVTRASPRQLQLQKPCLVPPFEIIPINENDANSDVLIVDDSYIESGFIGCMSNKYLSNLDDILNFLKKNSVSKQAYIPKINEYCIAIFEDEWHRAKVVEIISDDKFLVVYIDFTNEMELTSKYIRRYPMSLQLPCYSTLCAIDGIPEELSDKQIEFLKSNCKAFTKLKITSVRVVDDIKYVKSEELLNKMRSLNLV